MANISFVVKNYNDQVNSALWNVLKYINELKYIFVFYITQTVHSFTIKSDQVFTAHQEKLTIYSE